MRCRGPWRCAARRCAARRCAAAAGRSRMVTAVRLRAAGLLVGRCCRVARRWWCRGFGRRCWFRWHGLCRHRGCRKQDRAAKRRNCEFGFQHNHPPNPPLNHLFTSDEVSRTSRFATDCYLSGTGHSSQSIENIPVSRNRPVHVTRSARITPSLVQPSFSTAA